MRFSLAPDARKLCVRFWNTEVMNDIEGILRAIDQKLKEEGKIY